MLGIACSRIGWFAQVLGVSWLPPPGVFECLCWRLANWTFVLVVPIQLPFSCVYKFRCHFPVCTNSAILKHLRLLLRTLVIPVDACFGGDVRDSVTFLVSVLYSGVVTSSLHHLL